MVRTDDQNDVGKANQTPRKQSTMGRGRSGRGGRQARGKGAHGGGRGGKRQARDSPTKKSPKKGAIQNENRWIWSHQHERSWGDILRERNLMTRGTEPFTATTGEDGALDESIAFVREMSDELADGATLEQWKVLFEDAYDNKLPAESNLQVIQVMVRLVATSNIFSSSMWKLGQIKATHETSAWIAARVVFMQVKGIRFDDDEDKDEAQATSPNPSSKKKSRKPRRKVMAYPRKAPQARELQSVNDVLSDFHKTFFDVRLPMSREGSETPLVQVIASLNALRAFIFRADSKAQILAWRKSKELRPWTVADVAWTNRETLKQFVESLYARTGFMTYTRIWVAHKQDLDVFEDDGTLAAAAISFRKSDIQEHNVVAAGWLFGSHSSMNTDDLAEVINVNELVKNQFVVQLRVREIQLVRRRGRRPDTDDFRNRPRATHIMCGESKARVCRVAMKEMFNHRADTVRLLGKQMRFMPDALDQRFHHPPSELANLSSMVAHQVAFEKKMMSQGVYSIMQLDVEVPIWNLTLREVVMNLRSFEDPDYTLFVSVDTDKADRNRTFFVFHPKRQVEARELISKLPFFCSKKLDHKCQGWFTPEAWAQNEFYDVDWETGLVRSKEELEMGQLAQAGAHFLDLDEEEMIGLTAADVGWEGYVDENGKMKPVPLLKFEVEMTSNPRIQNGDNGTVATFATATVAQQSAHVGTAIANTARNKSANPRRFAADPSAKTDFDVDNPGISIPEGEESESDDGELSMAAGTDGKESSATSSEDDESDDEEQSVEDMETEDPMDTEQTKQAGADAARVE